jgi:mxaJ protein
MRLLIPSFLAISVTALAAGVDANPQPQAQVLRVCADPNNLPFSNQRLQGFENKIADVVASELHTRIEYVWWSQRKNFVRNTLNAGKCDLVLGVPSGYEKILTTKAYYRSTYVWVSRRDKHLKISSVDDPILKKLRIGVHVTDDNYAPPAQALARRGIVNNIKGYSLLGAVNEANPPARLVEAVKKGDVDVAIAWGPLVGYFIRNAPLDMVPIAPGRDGPIPFTFDISMGVQPKNAILLDQVDHALLHRQADVRRILMQYGVPLL